MTLDVKIFDPNEFKVFTFDINEVDVKTLQQTATLLTKCFGKNYVLLPNCFEVYPKVILERYKKTIEELLKENNND